MAFWKQVHPEAAPQSLVGLLERAVVALERLAGVGKGGYRAPGAPSPGPEGEITYVDDLDEAIREIRRLYYERSTGKPLRDDEDPPELPGEEELRDRFVAPGE